MSQTQVHLIQSGKKCRGTIGIDSSVAAQWARDGKCVIAEQEVTAETPEFNEIEEAAEEAEE